MKTQGNTFVVVGGTGQTGHRIIEELLARGASRVLATCRTLEMDPARSPYPCLDLGASILEKAELWGDRVAWSPLDFEANEAPFGGQLRALSEKAKGAAPEVVFSAAAWTNVDGCEQNPALSRQINVERTVQQLGWAKALGARAVFYSSDYVFDGASGPYREEDRRNPLNVYGRDKAAIEDWMAREMKNSLVVRTTGVFDDLPGSKNFVMNMRKLWADGVRTKIPKDQISNPVWAAELAKATVELCERAQSGVFHVAGGSMILRTDFARMIANAFGLDPGLIEEVETADLKQPAKRPLRSGLVSEKTKSVLGWAPRSAEQVLREMRTRC